MQISRAGRSRGEDPFGGSERRSAERRRRGGKTGGEARRFRSSNFPLPLSLESRCLNSRKHYTANYDGRGMGKNCRAIISKFVFLKRVRACVRACVFSNDSPSSSSLFHENTLRVYIYIYIYVCIYASWEDIGVSLRLRC